MWFLFLGCGLTAEILHDVAKVWDIPIIGCPASGVGLSAPSSEYVVLSRTSITYPSITYTIMRFFSAYNYTTPAVFQDQSILFYHLCGLLMQATIRLTDDNLFYRTNYFYFQSTKTQLDVIQNQMVKASLSSRGKISQYLFL
jgi:hypothetical protein